MKPAAFFDLDDTLIIGTNSLLLYVKYLVKKKQMRKRDILRGIYLSLLHKLNLVDIEKLLDNFVLPYAGRPATDIENLVKQWFEEQVTTHLSQEAKKFVQEHKAQGHTTILLSNSSQFICQLVANYYQLDFSLSSIIEIKDGKLTGKMKKPLCYQEGKVIYATAFAQQNNIDLSKSYFYTDSYSDLPMLQAVGHPRIINPDPILKRYAKKMNWNIQWWKN